MKYYDDDELALALVHAQREFRVSLLPQTAEHVVSRVAQRYRRGESFRDALNAVMNALEFPNRAKRLALRQVIGAVLGRRGGLARKRAA